MLTIAVLADANMEFPAELLPESDLDAAYPVRHLECDEALYTEGEAKTHLYRIEKGVMCVSRTRWDGKPNVIEFAFAGDIIGMGFLEQHACSARATMTTRVTCLPLDAADRLSKGDDRARARLKQAMVREFEFRRESLVSAGRGSPIARVAALLLTLSRRNTFEGRDPHAIDNVLSCTVVADYLALSFDTFATALTHLQARGLIESGRNRGLRILDVTALETISNDRGG
jgi:CRP/FNR family transcriptional regulator, anaerobic regulatory protein